MNEKRALTTGEIAKFCGVNFRTVIRWIEKGYMSAYKLPGRGDNRVTIDEFLRFLESNNMPVPDSLLPKKGSLVKETKAETASNADVKQKILVVEDEENMAKAIRRALVRAGYSVELAGSGVEAGIKLANFKPDLVTLDLNMPGMSGLEVLQYMNGNEAFAEVKVLLVSAAEKAELVRGMSSGADAVLEKPFQNEELLSAVAQLLV